MGANCPSINTENVDPSPFWDSNGIHWDAHRTGWAVSAGCTLLVSGSAVPVGGRELP